MEEENEKLSATLNLIWTMRYFRKHRKECMACADEIPEATRLYKCMVRLMASYGKILPTVVISLIVVIITAL